MDDLEAIVNGVLYLATGVVMVAVPLFGGLYVFTKSYNAEIRNQFLAKELDRDVFDTLRVYDATEDPERKGVLLMPVECAEGNYMLELKHVKSHWLADAFSFSRLYEPVRLVEND